MASPVTCGLILLGNTGVGKSFLANRLLNDDSAFESRFSARSVTHHTEWKEIQVSSGGRIYSVANIPGLIEANQNLVDANRQEIMKAVEEHPLSIVIFVFGHRNGRISDEDLAAFKCINDAYEFPSGSLLIIVNGIPSDQPTDYEEHTAHLLHELIQVDMDHIYFIEKTTSDEKKQFIHEFLHEAVGKCQPSYQEKKRDIHLITDEISQLKAQSKQRQEHLLIQQEEYFRRQQQMKLMLQIDEDVSGEQKQKSAVETKNSKLDLEEQKRQFDQWMNVKRKELDQSNAELKQLLDDPERDTRMKLAEQARENSQRNMEMIARVTVPSIDVSAYQNEEVKTLGRMKKIWRSTRNAVDRVFSLVDSVSSSSSNENEQYDHPNPRAPVPHYQRGSYSDTNKNR